MTSLLLYALCSQDEDNQVFKRDFAKPTLEDHFDKTVLPKVMQVCVVYVVGYVCVCVCYVGYVCCAYAHQYYRYGCITYTSTFFANRSKTSVALDAQNTHTWWIRTPLSLTAHGPSLHPSTLSSRPKGEGPDKYLINLRTRRER